MTFDKRNDLATRIATMRVRKLPKMPCHLVVNRTVRQVLPFVPMEDEDQGIGNSDIRYDRCRASDVDLLVGGKIARIVDAT